MEADLSNGEETYEVSAAAISPNGQFASLAVSDGTVTTWKTVGGDKSEKHEASEIKTIGVSPDGYLALANRIVRFKSLANEEESETGDAEIRIAAQQTQIAARVFSNDGQLLADVCDDDTVRVWEIRQRRKVVVFNHAARAVAFSPDGQTLATAGDDGIVILWGHKN
jgi:WD40 repeat protein